MSTRGFAHEKAVSNSLEWYTPKWVFDGLDTRFAVDVCSPGQGKTWVPADTHLTVEDDGLVADWPAGLAWCNPPYGRGIEHWLKRCSEHEGGAIALVFSRTETAWFQKAANSCHGMLFISKRIAFHPGDKDLPPPSSSPVGSVLMGFSQGNEILKKSSIPGVILERGRRVAA